MGDRGEHVGPLMASSGVDLATLQQVALYAALALLFLAAVVRLGALVSRGKTIASALLDFGKGTWTRFEGSVVGILLVAAFFVLGTALGVRLAYESMDQDWGPPGPVIEQGGSPPARLEGEPRR